MHILIAYGYVGEACAMDKNDNQTAENGATFHAVV